MRTYDILNAGPHNRFTANGRVVSNSGAIVQLQNLYRNSPPDLAHARELVKLGDYDALDALYDSVPEVLAQCVRTAFVPQQGMKFIVADFSAIEARVVAWLAGENWKVQAFANGKDIYCETASKMFHKKVVKHGENGELRQLGKVAELACVAIDNLVLTDIGLVPIQNVTKDMKLWDGEEWVSHDGVIYKGEREVITYDGLTATPDHVVFVEGETRPVRFEYASTQRQKLIQTGYGRQPIRLHKNNFRDTKVSKKALENFRTYSVSKLRVYRMEMLRRVKEEVKKSMRPLPIWENTSMAKQAFDCGKTTMHQSKRCRIQKLWSKRNKVHFFEHNGSRTLPDSEIWFAGKTARNRSNRYERRLCTRKSSFFRPSNKLCKSAKKYSKPFRAEILALFIQCSNQEIISRNDTRRDYTRRKKGSIREAEKLAWHTRTVKVYDILNAGRHHRFTVSDRLVHNCSYGGSVGALKTFGALENGVKEEELQPIVQAWRSANSKIVQLWKEVEQAAKLAIQKQIISKTHGLKFECRGGMMYITLPFGRMLSYVKPRIGFNRFGSESIEYMGMDITKHWGWVESFGGKIVENVTQSVSRDILCHAMNQLRSYRICAHVHDEVIIECPMDTKVDEICKLMATVPSWAEGLPLRADGYECNFYRKD